jgi:hypothetical protein
LLDCSRHPEHAWQDQIQDGNAALTLQFAGFDNRNDDTSQAEKFKNVRLPELTPVERFHSYWRCNLPVLTIDTTTPAS